MRFEKVTLSEMVLVGVGENTSNEIEANFEEAKIPSLWRNYFQSSILSPIENELPDTPPYCAYYNHDEEGNYTVLVGARVSKAKNLGSYKSLKVPTGEYLRFDAKGKMPQTTYDLWKSIWDFFDSHLEHERACKVDFEVYEAEDEVSIYIGLK